MPSLVHRHRLIVIGDVAPRHRQRLHGAVLLPLWLAVPVFRRRRHAARQRRRVVHLARARAALARKRNRRRKDAAPALPRLHRARRKGPPVAHALHVEQDRRRAGAGEQKVAVARVDEEIGRHRLLRRREALRNHGAAVDAPRTGRVPRLARIGEDVLCEWRARLEKPMM
ncbi:hypothetical protein BBAD15_g7481 [Beauveria bassiana D1-5]|uniref:Uncharacterized protein n=1 Tax=Beauveria bassiana D1-5 TaxID=1245745 RepID=A0A0A2VH88_BEABA|nr:hypothetical protein BBAD15_g7481 [Beauveria bassiana D1-5]